MRGVRFLLVVAVVGTSAACTAPLVRDARSAGITVEVRECDVGARFVRSTIEVSSADGTYGSVVVVARLVDAGGEVSHTSEVAEDVEPGRVARLATTLRILRTLQGAPTCSADLLYANP